MPKFVEGFAEKIIIPPGARDALVFDTEVRGFGIRKYADGKAFYIVKFSHQGKQRRQSLGEVTRGNLRAMRLLASDAKAQARQGRDILAERQAARQAVKNRKTLGGLVPEYLKACEARLRPRTYSEVDRYLRKAWEPLHDNDIKTIIRNDVMGVLDTLKSDRGPRAADCAKVSLHGFFAWAMDHKDRYADANPVVGIRARAQGGSRERVLTEAEVREVWHAAGDGEYGAIIRLLVLSGQRKSEVGDLVWSEINVTERRIELPGARTKNKRPHTVPLSDEALALLPMHREGHEHLFGRRPGSGFSGWSKAKAELDARIAAARKANGVKKPMAPWTIHDLRRSFVTHVLDRKLALPHVVEAIINHVSGHKGGVAGIYNRAIYADEKRAALEAWGKHVTEILR